MQLAQVEQALILLTQNRYYALTDAEIANLEIAEDLFPFLDKPDFVKAQVVKILVNAFVEGATFPVLPGQAVITDPEDEAVLEVADVTIAWDAVSGALSYDLQVDDTDTTFGSLVVDETDITDVEYLVEALSDSTYYVRVRAVNGVGNGEWSEVVEFEVDAVA